MSPGEHATRTRPKPADLISRLRAYPQRFLMKNPPALLKPVSRRRSFLRDVFTPLYYPKLDLRRDTLLRLFELLEQEPRPPAFTIVETGTSRYIVNNVRGDGASTFLFDAFVRYFDGRLTSIDLDAESCRRVSRAVSAKTRVLCGDSLVHLKSIQEKVDVVYLDSMDYVYHPEASAEHHVREFEIIDNCIRKGGFLLIDDSPASPEHLPSWVLTDLMQKGLSPSDIPWPNGKGYRVIERIEREGNYAKLLHTYQCLFQKLTGD